MGASFLIRLPLPKFARLVSFFEFSRALDIWVAVGGSTLISHVSSNRWTRLFRIRGGRGRGLVVSSFLKTNSSQVPEMDLRILCRSFCPDQQKCLVSACRILPETSESVPLDLWSNPLCSIISLSASCPRSLHPRHPHRRFSFFPLSPASPRSPDLPQQIYSPHDPVASYLSSNLLEHPCDCRFSPSSLVFDFSSNLQIYCINHLPLRILRF
ncbi:hypothetical protein C8R47DRAFT_535587 [Mycena vitilis]|nr:hypothetical protein C8R47DRAFT_535587 [Mycena vitilis]